MLSELRKRLKNHLDHSFGIIGDNGAIIMSSDSSLEGKEFEAFDRIKDNTKDKFELDNLILSRIKSVKNIQYYVFMENIGENSHSVLEILCLYVSEYLKFNAQKYDRRYFIKQLIQGELDKEQIQSRNSIFKLVSNVERAVLTVKTRSQPEFPVIEILENMFHDEKHVDYVQLDNEDTLVILPVSMDLSKAAHLITATIEEQLMVMVKIAIGRPFVDIYGMKQSYETSVKAFYAGPLYIEGDYVYDYNSMGAERLFHDIPVERLKEFIEETITNEVYDKIDEEAIKTMQAFFENNLNISETARKMYLHRNTLVYRIEKFNKLTHLDITNFDSAVLFYIITQIKSFLSNIEREDNDIF